MLSLFYLQLKYQKEEKQKDLKANIHLDTQ